MPSGYSSFQAKINPSYIFWKVLLSGELGESIVYVLDTSLFEFEE